ncbi:hypothetical protein GEMRC1_002053 [Eukaryota sp. GEM-RC1]
MQLCSINNGTVLELPLNVYNISEVLTHYPTKQNRISIDFAEHELDMNSFDSLLALVANPVEYSLKLFSSSSDSLRIFLRVVALVNWLDFLKLNNDLLRCFICISSLLLERRSHKDGQFKSTLDRSSIAKPRYCKNWDEFFRSCAHAHAHKASFEELIPLAGDILCRDYFYSVLFVKYGQQLTIPALKSLKKFSELSPDLLVQVLSSIESWPIPGKAKVQQTRENYEILSLYAILFERLQSLESRHADELLIRCLSLSRAQSFHNVELIDEWSTNPCDVTAKKLICHGLGSIVLKEMDKLGRSSTIVQLLQKINK